MLRRKQDFNLQFLQIVDAFLLVIAFWGAHTLCSMAPQWGLSDSPIQPFREFQWLLFVLVPFGPICLEAQGYYEHPARNIFSRSLVQIGRAGLVLGFMIALCSYFLRLALASRAIIPLFFVIATASLLVRQAFSAAFYRRRVKTLPARNDL